jgi:hypothetical protein
LGGIALEGEKGKKAVRMSEVEILKKLKQYAFFEAYH